MKFYKKCLYYPWTTRKGLALSSKHYDGVVVPTTAAESMGQQLFPSVCCPEFTKRIKLSHWSTQHSAESVYVPRALCSFAPTFLG